MKELISSFSSVSFPKKLGENMFIFQNFENKEELFHKLIDGKFLDEWRTQGMEKKEVLEEIENIIRQFDISEDVFLALFQYHAYYSSNQKKAQIIQELLAENANISKMNAENQAKISNLNDQVKILTENTISETIEQKIKLRKLNLLENLEDPSFPLSQKGLTTLRTVHSPEQSKNNSLFTSTLQNFNPSPSSCVPTPTNESPSSSSAATSKKKSFFFSKAGRNKSPNSRSNDKDIGKDNSGSKGDISSAKDQEIEILKNKLAESQDMVVELRKSHTTYIQKNSSNVSSETTTQIEQLKETAASYEELYCKSRQRMCDLKAEVMRLTNESLEQKSKLASKDQQIMQLEAESTNNQVSNLKIVLSNRKGRKTEKE